MGKALIGTYAPTRTVQLLDEVRALRQRVAELEQALATAEAARDRRADDDLLTLDQPAAVSS